MEILLVNVDDLIIASLLCVCPADVAIDANPYDPYAHCLFDLKNFL
ncbi:MAG: hypothetical protein JXB42_01825 [Deltaproteobacteria bacterium]|nr:hypothetical protein [Deltaproteobacteria bacterium]